MRSCNRQSCTATVKNSLRHWYTICEHHRRPRTTYLLLFERQAIMQPVASVNRPQLTDHLERSRQAADIISRGFGTPLLICPRDVAAWMYRTGLRILVMRSSPGTCCRYSRSRSSSKHQPPPCPPRKTRKVKPRKNQRRQPTRTSTITLFRGSSFVVFKSVPRSTCIYVQLF